MTRDKLVEYAMRPFFGEFVQGLYVRMSLGPDPNGLKVCVGWVGLGGVDLPAILNLCVCVLAKALSVRRNTSSASSLASRTSRRSTPSRSLPATNR